MKIIYFFMLSFVLTAIITPFLIKLSKRHGLSDQPNNRKIHKQPIPILGGVAIFFGIFISAGVFIILNESIINSKIIVMIISSAVLLIMGIVDDIINVSATYKLLIEFIVVLFVINNGFLITTISNPFSPHVIELGLLAYPVTVLWFLVIINAINIIDGLDGLAAGISAIVFGVFLYMGKLHMLPFLSFFPGIVLGSLLAFLLYNTYPAKIFMGDCGSIVLGFLLAAVSIYDNSFKSVTTFSLLFPVISLFIPLGDLVLAVFRRIKNKKNIFQADKEHIHHKLLLSGISHPKVVFFLYIITVSLSLFAISIETNNTRLIILFGFLVITILFFLFRKFNKGEIL